MSSWVLTPKQPDPFTGLQNKLLAWHVTAATVVDVMEGCNIVSRYGWLARPTPVDMTVFPPIWVVEATRPAVAGTPTILVPDTAWMVLDGEHVRWISEADVNANYNITQWPGPPPPPPPPGG